MSTLIAALIIVPAFLSARQSTASPQVTISGIAVDSVRGEMSPDNLLSGAELAGVEIYDELSAPAEFSNGQNCSVVVIWTKQKLGY